MDTIIYDTTGEYYDGIEIAKWLYKTQKDTHSWKKTSDVQEQYIYDEIQHRSSIGWEEFRYEFKKLLEQNDYIIMGTFGRWNGPVECGTFIREFSTLNRFLSDLDDLTIIDRNGHLFIKGYHHDGTAAYEMRKLTDKGKMLAERYSYAHDIRLHKTVMTTNFYSGLPRFAKTVYGV